MRGEDERVESRIDMVLMFWIQGDVHNLNVVFIFVVYRQHKLYYQIKVNLIYNIIY